MSAYELMKRSISRSNGSNKADLTKKTNTFYAAGQLIEEEYMELIGLINAL